MAEEFEAFSKALAEFGHAYEERGVGRLTARAFDGGSLILAQGGLGKAQFGVQTQHLINHLGTGRSGGVRRHMRTAGRTLSVGDVVVATQTVEHDFNRGQALITLPLPTFEGDAALIDKLEGVAERKDFGFGVRFGGVASGDEGIASERRIKEVRADTGAVVVAWEGAGGARAAQLSGVPFLEIRGISDGAGENAMQEFWANIPIAVGNVAAVVRELPPLLD